MNPEALKVLLGDLAWEVEHRQQPKHTTAYQAVRLVLGLPLDPAYPPAHVDLLRHWLTASMEKHGFTLADVLPD